MTETADLIVTNATVRTMDPSAPEASAFAVAGGAIVAIGSRAWWRHAKAGELCERFDTLLVVDDTAEGPAIVDEWPTYRGEGKCFG